MTRGSPPKKELFFRGSGCQQCPLQLQPRRSDLISTRSCHRRARAVGMCCTELRKLHIANGPFHPAAMATSTQHIVAKTARRRTTRRAKSQRTHTVNRTCLFVACRPTTPPNKKFLYFLGRRFEVFAPLAQQRMLSVSASMLQQRLGKSLIRRR